MITATAGLSTKERLENLVAVLGPFDKDFGTHFTGLAGQTLCSLVDSGVVVLAPSTERVAVNDLPAFAYDAPELFKGVDDHKALAFVRANPRFSVSGWLDKDDATIVIDTIIGGLKKHGDGFRTIPGSPVLTKKQMVDFANVFHKADEFQLGDNFAYAWFD
jgi:hypothetical protein